MNTVVTRQYLCQQVYEYAKTQRATDFGWREIFKNARKNGAAEIMEILTDSDAFDVPTAIAAVQAVATALNED